ncbi:hypothetical protein Enr10x_21020 [Gimesia panareensis]|uniref:Uncharacterized protein n=1 Tax=Gimesia panareensis TaxID=2527978 RepID=A0A517Q5D3_9PLAN|nr:hypothetical protein [Gimesia panareensis]QDT26792.1 hypothetical protein Enr10x_21020 [Gimesia panareensis]
MPKICFDLNSSVEQMEQLNLVAGGELTISSGAITITRSLHTVDTEGDAVTDDLHTINGGSAGDVILLGRASTARAVVLKHNAGNIKTPAGTDHELTANGFVLLKHDGSNWHVQSGNGSGYALNKLACLTVVTSNVTLNDTQTQNGVYLGANARVFLAGQTDPTENGPWIVKEENPYYPSSGDWIRPDDFQDGFSVSGHLFYIESGTEYAETVWMIANTAGEDIVGTDDLVPVHLGNSDAGGTEFDISTLTAESSNADDDLIAIYDTSAAGMRKQTRSEFLAGVSGGSGVPSTRTLTAGIGLTGGGDLSADRTFALDLNGLTAESTASDSDYIAIYDGSAGAIRKQTRGEFLSGVTSGSVPTSRTISAGVGISGGGDLSADRTLSLDITGLTEEASTGSTDLLVIYDASAGEYRKQTRSNFIAGITSGYVPTSRSISTGVGLTGGGNLSADRTISIDITGLSLSSEADNNDQIMIYDGSAFGHRRQTRQKFLSDVFLVDGSRALTGQLLCTVVSEAASIAAPQVTADGNTDTGFYFAIGNNCGIACGGDSVFTYGTVSRSKKKLYCESDLDVTGQTILDYLNLRQIAEPATGPSSGEAQLFISDGTGIGDAGDLMIKINSGGTTKVATLVDYSTL